MRQQDEAEGEDDPDDIANAGEPPPLPMFTWYEETAGTRRRWRADRSG